MLLKKLFFALFVRPFVMVVSGVYLNGKENLPKNGPAILVANHNSHLDTLVVMSLFSLKTLEKVRPIGAEDYFFSNRVTAWLSRELLDIIPLKRRASKRDGHPFNEIYEALDRGDIVLLFPEGSRGEAEVMKPFKRGIAHIAKEYPHVPVVPLYIHGAGKALPKGEALFVPFIIEVNVGKSLFYEEQSKEAYTQRVEKEVLSLESSMI